MLINLPQVQCTAATNHLITNAVLNISSDLLIISIPLPIVIAAQFPWKRKLILCGVFALGLFTVSTTRLEHMIVQSQCLRGPWMFSAATHYGGSATTPGGVCF